jgi:hypothetical protein
VPTVGQAILDRQQRVEYGWSRDVLLNQIMARSHLSGPAATEASGRRAGEPVR